MDPTWYLAHNSTWKITRGEQPFTPSKLVQELLRKAMADKIIFGNFGASERVKRTGIITFDREGSPQFSQAGKELTEILRQVSEQIVKTAKNFEEMKDMAAQLLSEIEYLPLQHTLKLSPEQEKLLRKIHQQIASEAIQEFSECFDEDFQPKPTFKDLARSPIQNASEPANRAAFSLIKVMHPDLPEEEINTTLSKLARANAHDIFNAVLMIFGTNEIRNSQQLDLERLKNHLDSPENLKWLPEDKQQKMNEIYQYSLNGATLNAEELKDLVVILEAIHLSWAASQYPREKGEGERFRRAAFQTFPGIKVDFTNQADVELAVLEVMKDIAHFTFTTV